MPDPFLTESLDRVLGMRVYEIDCVTNRELSGLREAQQGRKNLTDHENRMVADTLYLYHSMHKFLEQLATFMREFFPPNLSLPALTSESPVILRRPVQAVARVGEEMICRLCETAIPLELLREHTAVCVSAHQRQYDCLCANERLQCAAEEIAAQLLNTSFEIRDPTLFAIVFPTLYIFLLVEVAVSVRPTDPDAGERLAAILRGMSFFKPPPGVNASLFAPLASLLQEKSRAVSDVTEAFGQWKATTQGGTSLTAYDISLADFEFIRRISSGAFARIYLGRKKSTKDLFAVKVIKRSHVDLKNQLSKVILERDILLKLNSPFTVHFCMFLAGHTAVIFRANPQITHLWQLIISIW
jgi:hypothetical protein